MMYLTQLVQNLALFGVRIGLKKNTRGDQHRVVIPQIKAQIVIQTAQAHVHNLLGEKPQLRSVNNEVN